MNDIKKSTIYDKNEIKNLKKVLSYPKPPYDTKSISEVISIKSSENKKKHDDTIDSLISGWNAIKIIR